MNTGKKKGSLGTRITNRYRLIIRQDDTLEERYTLILTPMNVILLFSGIFVMFFLLSAALFFYTPLKEYVPGYQAMSDPEMQIEFLQRIDSLEHSLKAMRLKSENLHRILNGEPDSGYMNPSDTAGSTGSNTLENPFYDKEQKLRDEMEGQKSYAVSGVEWAKYSGAYMSFFNPLQGLVSDTFDVASGHYAIDLVAKRNSPVKATLDGTVVFSGWTPESGHVMVLQHSNDWVSIYKHNSANFKKEGNFVSAGEAIALVGNSGELSSGPHLHFELWHKGKPVNPGNFLYN